jgi:hypothetical protein
MPLQATSGAASYDGFGGGAAAVPNYIEDVFSTYLYTGNAPSTQTITNGIDLSTKGGLVWTKGRPFISTHFLVDSARGISKRLSSNTTNAEGTSTDITAFTTSGFSLGSITYQQNDTDKSYVSWTFRKQPKFFDVVTWSGNDVAGRAIPHSLGSVPGCIIVKRLNASADWQVAHRSLWDDGKAIYLNQTSEAVFGFNSWFNTIPTSTNFYVGADFGTNLGGGTYVAYLFAHNAGGFGLSGTDNVISCGSYVGNGSTTAAGAVEINLGYEPQWVLVKSATSTGGDANWSVLDTMRGWGAINSTGNKALYANTSGAEQSNDYYGYTTSTGFKMWETNVANSGTTYIYIAIRRGPMKVPTTGTSVYNAVLRTGTGATATVTGAGFVPDLVIPKARSNSATATPYDRLRGPLAFLQTSATNPESSAFTDTLTAFGMNGFTVGADASFGSINQNPYTYVNWMFGRAPSFFGEVCYTGTGSARTVAHNLGAVPELMIVKSRTATWNWAVYHSALGNTQFTLLDSDGGPVTQSTVWNNTSPTSSVFTVGSAGYTNASAGKYVAYLFATCAGVSKVGSYTGTGTTKQIDCGFTGGARFVLIKRSQDGFSGDWYVWDSARGIVSGNDSYLLLNSTAAEVTSTDYIDTYSAGFEISSTAPAAINASGGNFVFLAIA